MAKFKVYIKMSGILLKNSFIFFFVFILNDVYSQGLQFHGNNNLIESRTSYNVFAKKPPVFKNCLKISFNLSINNPNTFGFILFVKDVKNRHYYNLVYSNGHDSISYLKFSIDSKQILMSASLIKRHLGKRKWLNILIRFNISKDSIEFSINDKLFKAYVNFSANKFRPLIFFGKHDSFIDVPDISIRKLRISDNNKSFNFDFKETKGSQVHDSKGIVRGKVENPIWLINESFYWKLRFKFSSDQVTAINFDPKQQRFFLINHDSIYFYDISKGLFTRLSLPEKTPVSLRLGLSFIPEGQKKICVYEVNDVEPNKPTVACLNLHTFQWKIWSYDQLNKQSHHHVGVFNSEKGEYLIFGGFGNKEYSNDFYSISKNSTLWKKIHFKGDTISPRFFSGCTKLNKNELLIFGGAGNPSGSQSAGKIYYTDCYRVNIQNNTIKKLWNTHDFSTNMVSGANLILSTDSTHFYSIYYPEYIPHTFLKLYKFSIKTGEFEVLGDSIPMVSERIRTNANLYFNRILNELYCVTQEFELDGSSKVKIYSISYPPVSRINYYGKPIKKTIYRFIYILFCLLTGCFILFLFWRKYKYKKKLEIQKTLITRNKNSKKTQTSKYKNAIYLFGNFKVFDKQGMEISHLFSLKIKQLFLLILLNSDENKITSKEIYSILWPERSIAKAKNSKGVVLNKLRKIVADIEGLELRNENRHLYFISDNNFYCDYFDFLIYLNVAKTNDDVPDDILDNLISILSKGRFLESIDLEYFDRFKQNFDNEVLFIIPFQLEKYFKRENYIKVIQLCKIIYHIDLINELAFHYELVSYLKLNMLDKAKKRFNAFIIDYKKNLNTDYNYTFHDLIDHKKSLEFIKQKSIY